MKVQKSWLLPATCTIILAVTTYATATTTQATRQRQAEVKLQQVAVDSPPRPLKYGDKTTKKIPNQEVLLLPTSSSLEKHANNLPAPEKSLTSNRTRLRVEQQKQDGKRPNVQISRRMDVIRQENQFHVQHDVPIVQKNREIINEPISTTVGQQRTRMANKSRNVNASKLIKQQQQPTQHHNLNNESERNIAAAKTTHRSRQRTPTIITTTTNTPTIAVTTLNTHQIPSLSSHNSNVRSHHPTGNSNNSSIVRHYHSNQRNRNHNINSGSSQPLLTSSPSSNAVAAHATQTKTESSSNARRQTAPWPTFQFPNSFNIFTPEFWQFFNPTPNPISRLQSTTPRTTTATTRKPPKKYKAPTQISTKEEKLSLLKQKPTVQPRTTTRLPELHTNNTPKKEDEPFRIALPTFNILSPKRQTSNEGEKGKRNVEKETIILRERFDCPRESEVRFQLFPKICKIDEDCKQWNREEICCDIFGAKSCVSGIPKPLEETSHAPILGVIPRKCPSRPLAELWWEVKECETDADCWPRVCCPDGRRRYCRTSQPELNTVPVPVQRSFNYLTEYLECTPAPPPIFDLHPKPCTSTLDCFPNVCCQEAGLRHCRPPKKSVLTMLANVFNVDFVKRLTQNIVIK